MYDKFLTYASYKDYKNSKYNIHPVNSIFDVDIRNDGIDIIFKKDLDLFVSSGKYKREIRCNSNIIIEGIKGKENEILKRIYVNISDCPIWSQERLLEIRKNQLEMKKQKRLALIKKVFPFIKND